MRQFYKPRSLGLNTVTHRLTYNTVDYILPYLKLYRIILCPIECSLIL